MGETRMILLIAEDVTFRFVDFLCTVCYLRVRTEIFLLLITVRPRDSLDSKNRRDDAVRQSTSTLATGSS